MARGLPTPDPWKRSQGNAKSPSGKLAPNEWDEGLPHLAKRRHQNIYFFLLLPSISYTLSAPVSLAHPCYFQIG
jgi:hypothetical protein